MKGISPIIATVLLIVLGVSVVGLVGMWISDFSTKSTQTISETSENEIACSFGIVKLANLKYCNNYMSGWIKNLGTTSLGNLTIQIIYQNSSLQTYALNGTQCPLPFTLKVGEMCIFNFSAGSNYWKVRVYSNCSIVTDESDSVSGC